MFIAKAKQSLHPIATHRVISSLCTSNDAEVPMNRLIGVLVIGFFAASSAVADQNNFRCYKSVGLKNTLRIQFVIQSDNDSVGYVIYEGGSARIPVKRLKEKELKRLPGEGHRCLKPGGIYVYVSQGAIVDNFRYIRSDGKVFRFVADLGASADNGCAWAAK